MHPDVSAFRDEFGKIAEERSDAWRLPVSLGVGLGTAGLGALGAGATYAMLRRKVPGGTEALRALQEAGAGRKFVILRPNKPTGTYWDALKAGGEASESELMQQMARHSRQMGVEQVPRVAPPGAPKALVKKVEALPEQVVLHQGGSRKPIEGAVNIGANTMSDSFKNKFRFHQLMSKGTPELMPRTRRLNVAMVTHGGTAKAKNLDVAKFRDAMVESHGGDFVIKPVGGARGSIEQFITKDTPLTDPRWADALKKPKRFLVQERLPIAQEYRVHSVAGQPFSVSIRHLPNERLRNLWNEAITRRGGHPAGGAFLPEINPAERKRLMDVVRKAQEPLPQDQLGHYGWDVARLKDGTYRIIEANPAPATLKNPWIARKLKRQVTGRWGRDVALPAAGAVGLTGVGAGGAASLTTALAGRGRDEE